MDTRGEIRNSKSMGIRWLHVGVVILYCVLHFVIGHYHEPWFDEAQAWQIAKCASIKEILFKIPHYEGHPPLWHLILAIPAKLGVPYVSFDGDQTDPRVFTPAQYETRVQALTEMMDENQ